MNFIQKYFSAEFLQKWGDRFNVYLTILFGLCFAITSTGAIAAQQIIEVQVSSSSDDAEEQNTSVSYNSSDLEMSLDNGIEQTVGIRFNNITIPKGVEITNAYIQFQSDERGSNATTVTIHGEATDNAQTFSSTSSDITSRPRTSASVAWTPPSWPTPGDAGLAQRTTDIKAIIQEITDRASWASGNSVVIMIDGNGTGNRTAESFNGEPSGAPVLHIEFGETLGNEQPIVDAGEDLRLISPADTLCLAGTASDDGGSENLNVNWMQQSGPETVTIDNPSAFSTSAVFPSIGSYNMSFEASDGQLSASDNLLVTVGRHVNVPGDAATIQEAVNLAKTGDVVIVAPGLYEESVDISDKTITLASHYYLTGDPADIAATIIDGGGREFAVRFDGTVGPESTIQGFHVRNGVDGIIGFAPIRVLNNRVTGCFDALEFKNDSGGLARGNLLELNDDDGVDLNRDTNLIVEKNIIRYNKGDGIEMRMHDYSGPTLNVIIRDNLIYENEDDGVQLIDYDGFSPRVIRIERNVISDNLMAGLGIMGGGETHETYEGASALETVIVTNNIFDGNNHGITGGDKLTARNNIFINQEAIAVKNIDGDSIVEFNLFWNNGTDIVTSNVDNESTLFVDPMLDENFHPLSESSVIDAGVDAGFPFNGLAPDMGAFETPVNAAPTVNAGIDQSIPWSSDNPVRLSGVVSDDGRPTSPGELKVTWSQLLGPCGVHLGDANAADTTAIFDLPGRYVFRLSADDGEHKSSDEVTVELLAEGISNRPPVANDDSHSTGAGVEVIINVVTNDNDPDGNLDSTSTNTSCDGCSGPANGTLLNNGDGTFTYTPTEGFSGEDSFVYQVCDTELLCDVATVSVSVSETIGVQQIIEIQVSSSSDDAEEQNTSVSLKSSDLEMALDKDIEQTVGIRFNNVTIPKGGQITKAYVQFQADERGSNVTTVTIHGEATDNAQTFRSISSDITSRPRTSASVAWTLPAWPTTGAAGIEQRTTDIRAVIQEITGRDNWESGNSVVLMIDGNGTGNRTAESFNGEPSGAPVLHIEFVGTLNIANPIANDDSESTTEGVSVEVNVVANDTDAAGNLDSTSTNTDCEECSNPANGTLLNNGDGTFTYSPAEGFIGEDSFIYQVCNIDALCDIATVTIDVTEGFRTAQIEMRVAGGNEDAEEKKLTGKVSLASSDLELVHDTNKGFEQIVGIRFVGVLLPPGAEVTKAYIQFTADETNSDPADLMIAAEMSDNASAFLSNLRNISSRITTVPIGWSPAPWVVVGDRGAAQRTGDLAEIVQQVADRTGWQSGNAMVMIIDGFGKRTAEAYNGRPDSAPLLHIEYRYDASSD